MLTSERLISLVSRLVRFCSNADGSLSAFLARNAAFRQFKAFASLQIFARRDTSRAEPAEDDGDPYQRRR